jgi:hypothetical protein
MGSKVQTLNSRPPLFSDLLCPIQSLFNLIYLAEQDADKRDEVVKYMAMANVELLRLSDAAVKIALPGGRVANGQSRHD